MIGGIRVGARRGPDPRHFRATTGWSGPRIVERSEVVMRFAVCASVFVGLGLVIVGCAEPGGGDLASFGDDGGAPGEGGGGSSGGGSTGGTSSGSAGSSSGSSSGGVAADGSAPLPDAG